MSGLAFRFLHTSDWHLELPASGLAEVPDHLREALVEAPYLAAERVIETALAERVDFVVLAGDIADVRVAGPVAVAFLTSQLERLHERGIATYWVAGQVDAADRWPEMMRLPESVQRFCRAQVEEAIIQRAGGNVAKLVATARDRKRSTAEWKVDASADLFTIVTGHGPVEASKLDGRGVGYWALGGRHNRQTLLAGKSTAIYCGSPQGRRFSEAGPHGCTLVEVGHENHVRTRPVATDVLRWQREELTIESTRHFGQLESLIEERLLLLAEQAADCDAIVHWQVRVVEGLAGAMARRAATELLEALRAKHGYATPMRWSAALDLTPAERMPDDLYAQDSILGDFLREIRGLQLDAQRDLELPELVSPRRREELSELVALADPETRARVLRQATALGWELLGSSSEAGEA